MGGRETENTLVSLKCSGERSFPRRSNRKETRRLCPLNTEQVEVGMKRIHARGAEQVLEYDT